MKLQIEKESMLTKLEQKMLEVANGRKCERCEIPVFNNFEIYKDTGLCGVCNGGTVDSVLGEEAMAEILSLLE